MSDDYTIKPHMDWQSYIVEQVSFTDVIEDENERYQRDAKVLNELYSTLMDEQIDFIKSEIEESEGGVDFEIVENKPKWDMEREKEDNNEFNVWVDQSTYGESYDSYHGYVYIEIIPNKKYLKWYYSM